MATNASTPSAQLAEGLRELANAAYGDPDASWDSIQQLIRDALLAAKVTQISQEMVNRAVQWHNSQARVLAITASDVEPGQAQVEMDRWLIGLLTAALAGSAKDIATRPPPPPPLTLDDLALEQYNAPGNTATFHFLVKGREVAKRIISVLKPEDREVNEAACRILTNVWHLEDKKELDRQWIESIQIIFGEEAQPFLDRLVLL